MAGTDGMLVFQRGAGNEDEYDSDVWDDTALIEAYDAAVAPLKAKLAEHTGDSSILDTGGKAAQSKKKKNKKKKARQAKKKQQASGWSVGDFCQAVYTEDGTVYEAKIVSVNPDDNTCVVRYLGYGNEEEQSLDDLIPHDSSSRKQRRSDSVSFSETESVASRQSSASRTESKNKPSSIPWGWPAFPDFHQGSAHPMHPPPPPPPLFPGMNAHSPFTIPQPPMGSAASVPFPMMPPPPPPMPNDNVSSENEALCSMLLSWYMSGYHTGYYQGLRQGRQHDASAAMGPSR